MLNGQQFVWATCDPWNTFGYKKSKTTNIQLRGFRGSSALIITVSIMIRFTARGVNLLLVAQGMALIGHGAFVREGVFISFFDKHMRA